MSSFRLLSRRSSRRLAGLVALAAGLLVSKAPAADFGLSVGGGAADGRVDCLDGFACDHHAGYGKAAFVYRPIDALEVGLTYFEVGDLKGADTTPGGTRFGGTFKLRGVALTAGYDWVFAPSWDLVARGGLASVRARFTYDAPFSGEPSKTTAQPYGGASVGYAITPALRIGLDYDATRLKAHVTRGVLQMAGVSLQFNF